MPVPVAWTIAGSDSGGGAGIQVDLKVMNAFGVHGCSVITALTAQNTLGVQAVEPASESMLRAQLESLMSDLPPAAIKTGMLGSRTPVQLLSGFLSALPAPRPLLVCDPVLKSTSGSDLLDSNAMECLVQDIFPHVSILTPNLPETEQLIGTAVNSFEEAASMLLAKGVQSVMIKGGHAEEDECRDYWTDGNQSMWLSSPRVNTRATHGTGCLLASAMASALALGQSIPESVITAKTYLNQCLHAPAGLGAGHGPMQIAPFKNQDMHRPELDRIR